MRSLRRVRGWKPAQAAEAIGVDVSAYYEWERGTHIPLTQTIPIIAVGFGIRARDFMRIVEAMP